MLWNAIEIGEKCYKIDYYKQNPSKIFYCILNNKHAESIEKTNKPQTFVRFNMKFEMVDVKSEDSISSDEIDDNSTTRSSFISQTTVSSNILSIPKCQQIRRMNLNVHVTRTRLFMSFIDPWSIKHQHGVSVLSIDYIPETVSHEKNSLKISYAMLIYFAVQTQ